MKFTYLQGRKVDNLAAHDNVQLTIQILAELEEQEQCFRYQHLGKFGGGAEVSADTCISLSNRA